MKWFQKRTIPDNRLDEARRELELSQADVPQVRELAADLERLHRENHITQRVHQAMRGGER